MAHRSPSRDSSYTRWIEAPQRSDSPEVNFGTRWILMGDARRHPTWQKDYWWYMAWLENTGELYARQKDHFNRLLLLGTFETRAAAEFAVRGWGQPTNPIYRNLTILYKRLKGLPGHCSQCRTVYDYDHLHRCPACQVIVCAPCYRAHQAHYEANYEANQDHPEDEN